MVHGRHGIRGLVTLSLGQMAKTKSRTYNAFVCLMIFRASMSYRVLHANRGLDRGIPAAIPGTGGKSACRFSRLLRLNKLF